jgi:hypothetical protein
VVTVKSGTGLCLTKREDNEGLTPKRLAYFMMIVVALILLVAPTPSPAQVSVGVSVSIGPPPLPVYAQPLCPGPGFIWLPGYWAWDPAFGYYWVPGMWAPAPFVGALWTPGYWGWSGGVYLWHEGYWGPTVGFYGGINYGFGYTGHGYYGGYWRGGRYYYNRTVNNVNVTNITTVYDRPVRHVRPAGPSFNGGHGGIEARPTREQLDAARERHPALTNDQMQQNRLAREDRKQRASVNHGRPAVAATPKPGAFSGHGFVAAERPGTPYPGKREGQGAPGEQARPPKHGPEIHAPTPGPGYPHSGKGKAPVKGNPQYGEHGNAPKGEHTAPPHSHPQKMNGMSPEGREHR